MSVLGTPSLLVGLGKSDITPPVGTPLSGYGVRHGKASLGVHDPLYARALSLTCGQQTFTLVSTDLTLIDASLRQAVLDCVRKTYAMEDERLILMATHTHSGGGAIGKKFWERLIMGKFQNHVFAHTVEAIASAIITSLSEAISVTAHWGSQDISDLVICRNQCAPDVPQTLDLLCLRNDDQEVVATLLFMAAHPTMLRPSNLLFSADFPGLLTAALEQQAPGSLALFINGAAADLRPKHPKIQDSFAQAQRYVQHLMERVATTAFAPIDLSEECAICKVAVKLPRIHIRLGWVHLPSIIGNYLWPRQTTFQAIRTGPLLWLIFPAELSHEVGEHVKEYGRACGLCPIILGYANDYIGYIVPHHAYDDHSFYPARAALYGKEMDAFVYAQTQALMISVIEN